MHCIGLMSGTSIDGVDGVLAEFDAQGRLVNSEPVVSVDMPANLRDELTRLQAPGPDEIGRAARAANALADLYATCVDKVLAGAGIRAQAITAIGAHGQTIRHDPASGYTVQILNGARLADQTGIAVVTDLRSADIAAGGQGAPLVPVFHARVFAPPQGRRRGIINIGGIANLSVLSHDDAGDVTVIGFDTGPGNTLLDLWCECHRGTRFDRDGAWATSGALLPQLLERLRADPYFALPAPKSTGRDYFHLDWLAKALRGGAVRSGASVQSDESFQSEEPALSREATRSGQTRLSEQASLENAAGNPADVQATLLALTVTTIADAVRAARLDEVFVCGGGAANPALMQQLARTLGPALPVATTQALGMPAQAVEATAFAWLARQRVTHEAGNLPAVTGARRLKVLGAIHAP